MKQIKRITILGMGALGILYGDFFARKLGNEAVTFLADADRVERYRQRVITCNGWQCDFRFQDAARESEPGDLFLFAVKAPALPEAVRIAAPHIGKDTIIMSVLNGISSEEVIGAYLGWEHIIYCVAQGMDAGRQDGTLTYSHMGQLCIGLPGTLSSNQPLLERVADLFDRIQMPYTLEQDILHRMWSKWMLNVGVNQVVMLMEGTYRTVQQPGEGRELMKTAMKEVIALAKAEGVKVGMEDLEEYVALVDTLNPDGMPSMRQDGLAGRKSEVELFSGTVHRRAKAAGIPVPVNAMLYEKILEKERAFVAS
jgi:2-dehydropantoate 2-reductase